MKPAVAPIFPYQALLLDADGILFRFQPAQQLRALARLSGLDMDNVQMRLLGAGFHQQAQRGRRKPQQMHADVAALLGSRFSSQAFAHAWLTGASVRTRLAQILAQRPAGTALALVANRDPLQKAALLQHPACGQFQVKVFSCDLGNSLPDPGLIKTALNLLELTPQQVLFVSQQPAHLVSAEGLGLATQACPAPDQLGGLLQTLGWPTPTLAPGQPYIGEDGP